MDYETEEILRIGLQRSIRRAAWLLAGAALVSSVLVGLGFAIALHFVIR